MGTRELGLQLWVFVIISILSICFAAYNPPDNYLINCGSVGNTNIDQRIFVGDDSQGPWTLSTSHSISANIISKPISTVGSYAVLYQTALIFTSPSSYTFQIKTPGWHFIRLYFFPFVYEEYDLSSAANFFVSTQGFTLLSNFKPRKSLVDEFKEYCVNITSNTLVLYFTPSGNSIAFVNAIEVVSVPDTLIDSDAKILNPPTSYSGPTGTAFETIYRINVGGPKVTPTNDTLWRTWDLDNIYLADENFAHPFVSTQQIMFGQGGATEETAPASVYGSLRQTYEANMTDPYVNATWVFPVLDTNFTYSVRLLFYDIVSTAAHELLFNVYIGSLPALSRLDLSQTGLAAPTFYDFVVGVSEVSRNLTITIQPSNFENRVKNPNAILNGLEIMKMNNSLGSLDGLTSLIVTSRSSQKNNLGVILGSIFGGFGAVALLVAIILLVLKKNRRRSAAAAATQTKPSITDGLKFPFERLNEATNNFDTERVIGKGGFGIVYMGELENTKVAVKRAHHNMRQGHGQFRSEINILSGLRHRHLASLVGYCDEDGELILVYEYMEKGSLSEHLYQSGHPTLSWEQRLNICIGAAKGLHYLHTGQERAILHRDVKSQNILLNEQFIAKIADFGLSKVDASNEYSQYTSLKGTPGYMDPDYYKTHQLTEMSDVYAFGVVLLEVLCAKPAVDRSTRVVLAELARECQKNGKLEEIIDPQLIGKVRPESEKIYVETTMKCLAIHGVDRPRVGQVLWSLEYALQLQEAKTSDDPEEDSIVGVVSVAPWIQNSNASRNLKDVSGTEEHDHSSTSESKIFSQIIADEGR